MQKETKIQGILMCLFYLGHLCLDLVCNGQLERWKCPFFIISYLKASIMTPMAAPASPAKDIFYAFGLAQTHMDTF